MPSPRILVADDQTDILQALRLLLDEAGFETDLVNSTDDVMSRMTGGPYDLLLMDLNYTRDTTSGREGLDLLDRVRARDPGMPVVVMTGWGSIETAVDAMRRGAKSFVQKPWDDRTLVEVVRREIDDAVATRRRDTRHVKEYDEARLIQRALLPAAVPQLSGCDVASLWTPASGIGGDCFDLLRFGDTRLGLSIADVVGKGLPAALLMSNLQAALRAFATAEANPREVCSNVNRLLCRNIAPGKFVTLCYAVIDTAQRTVSYTNAGHNPPLLVHADGSVDRLAPTGLVLGVIPDWHYDSGSLPVASGDRLVFFTDGITEALSPAGDEFGDERLVELLVTHRSESASHLIQRISEAVADWTGGSPQDDATLIAVVVA